MTLARLIATRRAEAMLTEALEALEHRARVRSWWELGGRATLAGDLENTGPAEARRLAIRFRDPAHLGGRRF